MLDSTCRACLGAPGTLLHRHCHCPAGAVLRRQVAEDQEQEAPPSEHDEDDDGQDRALPYTRGLIAMPPPALFRPALVQESVKWIGSSRQGIAQGILPPVVWGDASGTHPKCALRNRVGTAVVTIDDRGEVLVGIAAPFPHLVQEVPGGELYGVVFALRFAPEHLTYYTDCVWVADGFNVRGRWATCNSNSPYAELWQEAWRRLEDLGGLVEHDRMVEEQPGFGFAIQWVPAHTSLVDVAKGRISYRNRLGNIAADVEAKRAASERPCNTPFSTALGEAEKTVRAATAYICQIGTWMRKHQPDALNEAFAKPSKQDALAVSAGAAAREKSQHQLQHDGKRWTCQVCGRHASSGKQRSILAKTSCYFHLPLVKAHSSHVLWQAGRLCFCANCGGFG